MKFQKDVLKKFPNQVEYALENYVRHNLSEKDFSNIVLAGLGGSGIAGRIVKGFFNNISTLPIEVISDYSLPNYVDSRSLVIISSYSGNTEETLSMYINAVEKKAKVLVISTGGLISELAEENDIQIYYAEQGFQPRMALGYSFTYLLLIFSELFKQNLKNNIKSFVSALKKTDSFIESAYEIFDGFDPKKKTVIVCDPLTFPIGVRFAQQINENAKAEAFVHELPEANHNVIESYYENMNSNFLFVNSMENDKVTYRFEFLNELLKKYGHNPTELNFEGFSLREIFMKIYTLDWLSLLIADARDAVSDQIPNINELKNFLKDK
jgi:glucose/mannose-6-phosphate isomerase